MENEDKYRVESAEEEPTERRGILKPLPKTASEEKKSKSATPIVKFLGIPMSENRKDILLVLLVPFIAGVIDANIMAYISIDILQIPVSLFFILSLIVAIPVGLTQTSAGRAVSGGLLNSLFFFILFVLFLASPSLVEPSLAPLDEFLIAAIVVTIGYFVMNFPGAILGSFFGQILKELL